MVKSRDRSGTRSYNKHSMDANADPTIAYDHTGAAASQDSRVADLPGFAEQFQEAVLVGQGGWGEVYFARHRGREVAVKFLSAAHFHARDRARFTREFELLRDLKHPNLVAVYEAGEWNHLLYYTMERIAGTDFLGYLQHQPEALFSLFGQLLETLHYIHGEGVLHRDLKPDNLLVEAEGRLRVLDFGIARHLNHHEHYTRTGALVGTPGYMSPEQLQGLEIDERSDLYAAGVVLYRALAGHNPFESTELHTILYKIVHEEPDWSSLQPPLRCVVQSLLHKDPQQRPRSALALLERWNSPRDLETSCPVKRQYLWDQLKQSRALSFLAGVGSGAALLAFF